MGTCAAIRGAKLNRRKSRNVKAQRIAVASFSLDAARTPLLIGGPSLDDWMNPPRSGCTPCIFTEVKFGQGSVKAAVAGPLTPHPRRCRSSQVALDIFASSSRSFCSSVAARATG
jgi:hypothetical protein